MKLQPRDRKLLENLYRFGVLTTTQVRRLCFNGIAHTTVLRRLRKLEEGKIILRISGLEEGLLCWSLTNFGSDQIGPDRPTEYRNKNILRHTTTLAEVRLALENVGIGHSWTSEVGIRRQTFIQSSYRASEAIIPDGLFSAKLFGKTQMVALELELSPKSRARYNDLFDQYARKDAIGIIWYVVESEQLGEALLRIWQGIRKFPDAPKFYISILSELSLDARKVKMTTIGETVLLEKLFELNQAPLPDHLDAQGLSKTTNEQVSRKDISTYSAISTA